MPRLAPTGGRSTSRSWGGARVLALRPGDARAARRDRDGRAPERDGRCRRTARASSWRARTRTRSGSSTSRRGAPASRSRSRSIPRRPPGRTPERARPVARRPAPCSWPTRTTTRSRWWTSAARREPRRRASSRRAGIRPGSSSPGTASASSSSPARASLAGQPARPSPASARAEYIGRDAEGSLSVLPVPDAATLAALHADGLPLTPVHASRATRPGGRRADSPIPAQRGRALADQARLLRHPREPHLRPDPRRRAAGQRRSEALPLRRGGHAQRARPGAGVRAPRQLLRQRRGELRRPRLLDRRLRDGRRREDLAA